MKKTLSLLLCLILILPLSTASFAGNNIPTGEYYGHFNLNIIGAKYDKNMDDVYGGSVIFVPLEHELEERTKIIIEKKEEFPLIVTDKNGTDGEASFILPKPGTRVMIEDEFGEYTIETNDFISDYGVYARPLGSPEPINPTHPNAELFVGQLEEFAETPDIWTYILAHDDFTMPDGYTSDDFIIVIDQESIEQTIEPIKFERKKGQSKFQDITEQVMTVNFEVVIELYVDLDHDGVADGVEPYAVLTLDLSLNLFDDMLESVFWEYHNDRLKLLQIRFYYNAGPKIRGRKK